MTTGVSKTIKLSLKTKLLVSFTLVMSGAFIVTYRWFYRFSTQQSYQQAQTTIHQVLDAALVGIDGTDLEGLLAEASPRPDGHTDDIRYWTHVSWLSLIESTNPNANLYTYVTSEATPNLINYLGSGSALDGEPEKRFLEPYAPEPRSLLRGVNRRRLHQRPFTDATGVWMRGVTPIVNADGETVAILAVDLQADELLEQQQRNLQYLTGTFITTYVLLFGIIYGLSDLLTRRINRLSHWTGLVASGDYKHRFSRVFRPSWWIDELDEVAIAFQQMIEAVRSREQQLKTSEENLESQVQQRTARLETALRFEAAIRRITDKVHESLEEDQILKIAVEELGTTLDILCCNTGIYDLETRTSTIRHGYSRPGIPLQFNELSNGRIGKIIPFRDWSTYQILLSGQFIMFCPLEDSLKYAILACPIREENMVLGDIWLFQSANAAYSAEEIEFVQQITNCCLIAIRQARLYRQTQTRLQEMEELHNLKDDFLSTVSHELRTPITNMRMAAKMLRTYTDPERRERYLSILESEVNREADLINDLLDLQRLDAGRLLLDYELIDIQALLPEIVAPFESRASERNLQLKLQIEPNVPPITCDRSAFKRVVSELLNNACKYTPCDEQIQILATSNQLHRVSITVTNYGVELPFGETERVFEKFYRVPNGDRWKQGGTGLGLALAKGLMIQLGGDILVESENNTVQFTLLFPQFISD